MKKGRIKAVVMVSIISKRSDYNHPEEIIVFLKTIPKDCRDDYLLTLIGSQRRTSSFKDNKEAMIHARNLAFRRVHIDGNKIPKSGHRDRPIPIRKFRVQVSGN